LICSQELLARLHDAACIRVDDPTSPDSLIGFFQQFRPDGRGLAGLFDDLPGGQDVHRRLEEVFEIAGSDRRGDGRRDVYFIVRSPEPISADATQQLAENWLSGVASIADATADDRLIEVLTPLPKVRVLEGSPPKHPKDAINQSELMKVFQTQAPKLTERIDLSHEIAATLRPAFYFINCDAMLRDYLMWPLYQEALVSQGLAGQEPLRPYFRLWCHGVKYRIMQDKQIDFYIPRRSPPTTRTIQTPLIAPPDAI